MASNASAGSETPIASVGPANGSASATDSPTAEHACDLLNPAEVTAIVGGPAPVAEQLPAGGWVASQCAWKGPTSAFLVSLGTPESISAFADPAAPDAEAKLADFKQRSLASGGAKDLAGIGDGAVVGTSGLAARIGGHYVEILRSTLSDEELVEVAKKIIQNL